MKQLRIFMCVVPMWLVLMGCQQQQSALEYTTVGVYPSTQQCGIDEHMLACDMVAAYLRDTLKLKPDHQIIVSSVGIDPLPKEDSSLERIVALITAAGYKDVRTARFDMQ